MYVMESSTFNSHWEGRGGGEGVGRISGFIRVEFGSGLCVSLSHYQLIGS